MAIVLIMTGVAIFLNGVCLCFTANMTMGTALTVLLGMFLICGGVFYKKIVVLTRNGAGRIIKIMVIGLICAELAFAGFIGGYGRMDTTTFKEDCVIILGAGVRGYNLTPGLKLRLDKSLEYIKKNPDAVVVAAGGKCAQEEITEASAMKKYLVENGVPEERILTEERSTSTRENMRFSKEILDSCFDRPYTVAFVTNEYHIYRSTQYAKLEGLGKANHLKTSTKWYSIIPSYIRESLAILKLWVFE